MPTDKGNPKAQLRVSYTTIADNPTATSANQILALLQRADTLLLATQSTPDFDNQPLLAFFSQPGGADWSSLIQGNATSATQASGPMAPQGSSELKGLAKQVQAINAKLGALQAYIKTTPKSYAAAAAGGPTQGPPAHMPKPPREPLTRARLVLVPQIPLDAEFNANDSCNFLNKVFAFPTNAPSVVPRPLVSGKQDSKGKSGADRWPWNYESAAK